MIAVDVKQIDNMYAELSAHALFPAHFAAVQ